MSEFKVSNFITLELEGKDTIIYVAGKRFQQCKHLFLTIPTEDLAHFDKIESIDEAASELDRSLSPDHYGKAEFSPKEEFWAHCSNIQAFYQNNYDTRILHSNLAFPLLKELYEAGDPIAVKVFKEEIAQRLSSKYQNTVLFLLENNYQFYFTSEEFDTIYQSLTTDKKELIKNFTQDRFNDNKTDNELRNRVFDYLEVMCSEQELKEYKYVTYKKRKFFVGDKSLIIIDKSIGIDKISELKGIKKLKGLRKLTIVHTPITSIDGLERLTNLEMLDLGINKIKTISGLETLINLKFLDLSHNKIEKISGLETLRNLEELKLGSNQLTELEGLDSLKNLKRLELGLFTNKIEKIKGLENLENLEYLGLSNNNISRISGLENLENLQHLHLDRNKVVEIEGLHNLKRLQHLQLERNCIIEIKGLESLINLENLDLEYNQISEMKGLETLHKLINLTLENNQIGEMKGLDGLINLRYVNLENNQIYRVHKIKGYMSLEYVNLNNNKLIGSLNTVFESFEEVDEIIREY